MTEQERIEPQHSSKRDPKIVAHIRNMMESKNPTDFLERVAMVRDDRGLTSGQRAAIFKTLAQEEAVRFHVACTGELPGPTPEGEIAS